MYELNALTGKFAPTFDTYILALDAWTTTGKANAGDRAMQLLKKMEDLGSDGKFPYKINNRALSSALTSITRSGGRSAPMIAQTIFERILSLYKEGDRTATINARTATGVLACIVRSQDRLATSKAVNLLQQMKKLSDCGLDSLKPNSTYHPTQLLYHLERMQAFTYSIALFTLSAIVYNCVLNGLAQKGMIEEAESIFEEMKELSSQGYPTTPDVVSVSCLCRALGNSKLPDAGPRAEAYLRDITDKYKQGEPQLKPDVRLYNAVITSYVKDTSHNAEAAERADALLQEMEQSVLSDSPILPDLVAFSCVCQGYAKSADPSGVDKVESVIERAEKRAMEGSVEFPDLDFYSSIVIALTRSKSERGLAKAVAIVRQMEELARDGRDVKPNTRVYNQLLFAYATGGDPCRVARAKAIFAKMQDMRASGVEDVSPDVFSRNGLILAAARSPGLTPQETRENMDLAIENFRYLHERHDGCKPDSFTYTYFLKACHMLLPEGETRQKLVSKAFDLCRNNGLTTKEVIAELFRAAPLLLQTRLQQDGVQFYSGDGFVPIVPTTWCFNVPPWKRFNNIDLMEA